MPDARPQIAVKLPPIGCWPGGFPFPGRFSKSMQHGTCAGHRSARPD